MSSSITFIGEPQIDQLIQQRTSQVELEHSRRQVQELVQSKQQLQTEVTNLAFQLDKVKNEESGVYRFSVVRKRTNPLYLGAKHQLQLQLNEFEISSSSAHSGTKVIVDDKKGF